MTLAAADAQPGDVVLAPDGSVCQYDGDGQWEKMAVVGAYGTPWAPDGELTLLARGGVPASPSA
jgi:mannose-6-phosphate isomerase-like protein (cupin superfamily)